MNDHVIIAGFGLPGRAVAEALELEKIPYCVLELNPETVKRAAKSGTHIVEGDVRDPATIKRAGIETASALIIAIPDEKSALVATSVARDLARTLNPALRIVSRTHYVSAGIDAHQRGADSVVIAEQVVAQEMSQLVHRMFSNR